jgi:hypothetical protein
MASSDINNVNVLSLPQVNNVAGDDFFTVFTTNGTKIVKFSNLNYVQSNDTGGVTFVDTISGTSAVLSNTITADSVNTNNLTVAGTDYTNIGTVFSVMSAEHIELTDQVVSLSSSVDAAITTLSATEAAHSAAIQNFKQVYFQCLSGTGATNTLTFSGIPVSVGRVYVGDLHVNVINATSPANGAYHPQIILTNLYQPYFDIYVNPLDTTIGNITVTIGQQTSTTNYIVSLLLHY